MAVPDEASGDIGAVAAERPLVKWSASVWSNDEDAVLREQVRLHGGAQNWVSISAALPGRTANSCCLRWCHHLAPGVDDAKPFTPEEDEQIIMLQSRYPNKWSTIAGFLLGRTDVDTKNRWNSVLCKQQTQEPVLDHYPPAETSDPGDDQSGSCLVLFPLAPGDLIRGNDASDAAAMDVDYGVEDPLTELRLWPSTTTRTTKMAEFKAMAQAVRAP
ncbi:transcription factor MYB44-like [Phragmites australis]|uniref:transcription factor MYB44-like n=1 Tax=Phragmites australis TaxID=29695 RepID=UPI002D78932A|nr:transcription factor MYB44-like [Phragmites australis]